MSCILVGQVARAQGFSVGGHVGALNVDSQTTVGYGAHAMFAPYQNLGLYLNATLGNFDSGDFFYTAPALAFYFPGPEELRLSGLVGGGFYKASLADLKFGLNFGVLGEFFLTPVVAVGAEARYHYVFDAGNVWNVFITANFKFSTGSDW